jgi:hypothetical protein
MVRSRESVFHGSLLSVSRFVIVYLTAISLQSPKIFLYIIYFIKKFYNFVF